MAYLLDANVFIEAKNRFYGFDFCPAFWDWIDAAHRAGRVFSIEKVADEIVGGGDDLATWAQQRNASFFLRPDAPVVASLQATSAWASTGNYEPAAVATFLQVGGDGRSESLPALLTELDGRHRASLNEAMSESPSWTVELKGAVPVDLDAFGLTTFAIRLGLPLGPVSNAFASDLARGYVERGPEPSHRDVLR